MRIIVAGGTGFVGRAVAQRLTECGHYIVFLQRPNSRHKPSEASNAEVAYVDQEKPIAQDNLDGDAIINLVGIIREFPSRGIYFYNSHFLVTKHLIDYARKKGIKRFLQMSALGVGPNSQTGYQSTKYAAEKYLRESGLDWTIFRPSIIYGPESFLIDFLAKMIRQFPIVPVIGDGKYKLQPVHIDDVSFGFEKSLLNANSIGMIFNFGGPEIVTYDQLIDIIGEAIGMNSVRKIHQPVWMLKPIVSLFQYYNWFPITKEQIIMLLESNFTEDKSYFELFGIAPKNFRESLSALRKIEI
jgi:nucleoside-diphosphate-sugar epimerase